MGRSGTTFLSRVMNRSEKWTVLHEPGGSKATVKDAMNRFSKDWYGEVNGYLRFYFDEIRVPMKGVIVRNPVDILMSSINWRNQIRGRLYNVERGLRLVSEIHESGCYFIRFEKMVSDIEYLKKIAEDFEVKDVDFFNIDLDKKVNASKKRWHWTEMSVDFRQKAKNKLGWFADNYGYDIEW